MNRQTTFVVDSNVFIEFSRCYPKDIAPTFWPQLIDSAKGGHWLSIDRVLAEIQKKEDTISEWSTKHKSFFVSTERNDVSQEYGRIQQWTGSRYKETAKIRLGQVADGWLVAYAIVESLCVVTNEVSDPRSLRNVKIPDICKAFGVDHVDMIGMIRALGIRLG